jgi:branched-chain amino acid transport system permease protein
MRNGIVIGGVVAFIGVVLLLGMGDPLGPNSFVVIGIASGAIYGLVALGLVLVYKGARVFNFAQAEFGTIAAFIMYVLLEQVKSVNIPYGVAVIIALAGATFLGLLMERIVVRPLLNGPRITLLVATIAFALLLIALEIMLFLPEAKTLPSMIAANAPNGEPNGIEIFKYILPPQQMLIIGVLAILAGVMAFFFSKTDLGLAVLATSQDAFATRVVGIGVERMSRFIWGASAFLGGVAGVLYAPIIPLTPGAMTTDVLIASFTAAVLGGMTSLPGAFVGGILVGLIQSLMVWATGTWSIGNQLLGEIMPGIPDLTLLLVLLIVLSARPAGLLGQEA